MLVSEVRLLPPREQFWYWIKERHQIYLRRKSGKPKPWTDDDVLRNYFFTNPYRENDKVTVWFRENIRQPLRDDFRVLFATVAFRWFNLPETADVLRKGGDGTNLLINWCPERAMIRLDAERKLKRKIFTGAYMINSPGGEGKLEAIIRRIDNVWKALGELRRYYSPGFEPNGGESPSMQVLHEVLTQFDGMGGFMAYEVVCDLRYTYLLENAEDIDTWCNVGPGARRGLYRLLGIDFPKGKNSSSPPPLPDEMGKMVKLLKETRKRLPKMPKFEMREIEMSLCEVDKYLRLLYSDGRSKRKFNGK